MGNVEILSASVYLNLCIALHLKEDENEAFSPNRDQIHDGCHQPISVSSGYRMLSPMAKEDLFIYVFLGDISAPFCHRRSN